MLVGNAKPSSKIVAARPQTYRQILHGKPQTRRGANPKNDVGGWQTPNPERGWETLTLCWVARPINPTRRRRLADPTTAKCGADSQALIGFKPALSVFRIDCLNRLPLNRPARLARIVLLNPGIVSEPCYSLFSTYRGTGDSKGPAMSAGLSGCRVQGCFRSPTYFQRHQTSLHGFGPVLRDKRQLLQQGSCLTHRYCWGFQGTRANDAP